MFDRKPPAAPGLRARRGTGERLRDALLDLAGRATVVSHREKSWASITFAGARHSFELVFDGEDSIEAGERFIAVLPDHEFAIPGQIVAEATVVEVDHRLDPPLMQVTCELLLLEDV
jgi:hypothetical protein